MRKRETIAAQSTLSVYLLEVSSIVVLVSVIVMGFVWGLRSLINMMPSVQSRLSNPERVVRQQSKAVNLHAAIQKKVKLESRTDAN